MVRTLAAIAMMGFMVGCSDDDTSSQRADEPTTNAPSGAKSDAGSSGGAKKDGSAAPTGNDAGSGASSQDGSSVKDPTATPSGAFDYENQTVELDADLVIPAGKTVRVGPGTTFHANGDYKVQVDGTLQVEGSAETPASFKGAGKPSSWEGIRVSKSGTLELSNAHISDAKYGLYAEAGSGFSVTDSVLDTSFKTAVVFSNGSFKNTSFKASVPPNIAITNEVSVDDPNGSLTIIDASPSIENCEFAGASPTTDLVRIGGQSSPTFDHVYLHDAHCAFHTNGGVNTSPRITSAVIENFSYGFMAYTMKPIVKDSVFKKNGSDFGLCLGATADNAPQLSNNFYSAGDVSLDPTCFVIGIKDPSPAKTENPDAGATGF